MLLTSSTGCLLFIEHDKFLKANLSRRIQFLKFLHQDILVSLVSKGIAGI